ncbi:hypothetical protein [Terrimonas pollutisoli]|uniref:hypothetical protein n=1 Tax=Terrimonas pollutisoli TaxID=3034147 RepID=UPI0023EC1DE1|nr:hypothetical protein [Terrimonas sp. H1YJ31]
MKRFLLIVSLFFVTGTGLFAQDDDNDGNEKIRDRMNEYIQKRLNLSNDEAKKFTPIFLQYFKEWRQTLRENKGDRLILQQKIVDLRLRYRTQFREILGEQRGNQVFGHQEKFIQELRDLRRDRLGDKPLKRGL